MCNKLFFYLIKSKGSRLNKTNLDLIRYSVSIPFVRVVQSYSPQIEKYSVAVVVDVAVSIP